MIRVYFDWNVFSYLKEPEYKKLKQKVEELSYAIQFPYSPAHFQDLMKSYDKNNDSNKYFYEDLNLLEKLSKTHLLRWEGTRTVPLMATPKEYFESNKNLEDISIDIEKAFNDVDELSEEYGIPKISKLMKSLFKMQPLGFEINNDNKDAINKMFPNINSESTMWDFMKDMGQFSDKLLKDKNYYKDIRKTIKDQGLKLDINSGNWDAKDVFDKLDKFLATFDLKLSFIDYVQKVFEFRKKKANRHEFFTTAYLLLDMLGYKSDKLSKISNNMGNITSDAEHAFYGAHCDFFIANDKKLLAKAKVLYHEFNIQTTIWTPEEFINKIDSFVHTLPQNAKDAIEEGARIIDLKNTVEFHPKSDNYEVDSYGLSLPMFYFNFFNYAIFQYYEEYNSYVITFRRVFKNYSDFIFYTELEKLINNLGNVFGVDNEVEFQKTIKDFVYNIEEKTILWTFDNIIIVLEKDVELGRANLKYFIRKNNSG
ncbi:MAG: hypothetical protein HQ534_01475 [Armatimonadetes bacterium]|nr:hypothetical protein [Armatimonadota bacterium]